MLLLDSTRFGHYYAHHQELATIILITTLIVSFCKDGRGSVNIKLWFLVVYVWCEVLCCLVAAGNATPSIFTEWNDQRGNQHHSRELLMMGILVPKTCWAYKKPKNKWHLVGFLFFSYNNDARSNKHQTQRGSLTDFMQKLRNITLFNLIHCTAVCVLQNTAEQNTPQDAGFQSFLLWNHLRILFQTNLSMHVELTN